MARRTKRNVKYKKKNFNIYTKRNLFKMHSKTPSVPINQSKKETYADLPLNVKLKLEMETPSKSPFDKLWDKLFKFTK